MLLSSEVCAIIEAIQVEQLEAPETTYNFEVADFHTYYVTKSNVLVHNMCVQNIETGGATEYSVHESSNSAYRAAKQYAGVPISEQPVSQSVNRLGKVIPGRTYTFSNGAQIMQHSAGHVFENGIRMSRHYNVLGSSMHFFY